MSSMDVDSPAKGTITTKLIERRRSLKEINQYLGDYQINLDA